MKKGFWLYLALFVGGVLTLMGASAEAQSVTLDTGDEGALCS
jgi:hypothetical protein